MAINRQEKEEILAKLKGAIAGAKSLVFANFKGLTVKEQNEMRKALRSQDIGYTVAKKTLIRKALESEKYEGELSELPGEIALVYDNAKNDELAPARELATFVKKFPEHLAFAGGVFSGKYLNESEIKGIASIPPLETLRAQFVQLINSPLARFAIVLNAKAQNTKS